MHIEEIKIFVAIVNTGSFTIAAEQLGLSKQLVSRRIFSLEKSLSTRLLIRNTRNIFVTEAGKIFLIMHVKSLMNLQRQKNQYHSNKVD